MREGSGRSVPDPKEPAYDPDKKEIKRLING
jgi:hypothetical protein